jgi:hypothetical protein
MSLYLGNTVISGVSTPVDGSIAIGQIITSSIPLTDAGLHLLDGALIQGGIYADFVQYIAGLVNTYPQCFCSEAEWQQSINTYGVCGKFVYNSTNNTVRLPKIIGFIEGTIDSNALGDLVEAGLPNITGTFGGDVAAGFAGISGAFTSAITSNNSSIVSNPSTVNAWGFNASLSNPIYGNSNTVQPQSIKVFYYIVIATTTKTDIEVDIDEIATDLNNKANDIDVVHLAGTETITGVKTLKNAGATIANPPSNISWRFTDFVDNNNVRIGVIGSQINPDGWHGTYLQAGNAGNISISTNGIDVITYAPTPSVSSNDTNIATTAYINNKFRVVSTLPANPDGNVYYFIPE